MQYEVIELGTLLGWPANTEYRAWAVNDSNIVVGPAYRPDSGQAAAWVWSLCGRYTLPAETMRDLSAALCLSGNGSAFDINEADLIVGEQVVAPWNAPRGYVWQLPTIQAPQTPCTAPQITGFVLAALTTNTNYGAYARSVNDAVPALIAGTSFADITSCDLGKPVRGFTYRMGDPATTLTTLAPSNTSAGNASWGRGVSSEVPAKVGGYSDYLCTTSQCDDDHDGLRWTDGAPLVPVPIGSAAGSTLFGAYVERLNNVGMGAGNALSDTWGCAKHAAFWNVAGGLTDLGGIGVNPVSESFGFGISPTILSGPVCVVGSTLEGAYDSVVWERHPTGAGFVWTGLKLSPIARECGATWELREARDVNSSGIIVGWGLRMPTSGPAAIHAFLLKPVCPGDLSGDCVVGSADLGVFLGLWGATACVGNSKGPGFYADFDASGQVSGADMSILLGGLWGTSCSGSACGGNGCSQLEMASAAQGLEGDEAFQAPIDLALLTFAAQSLGFESLDAMASWIGQASPDEATGVVESFLAIVNQD